MTLSANTDRLPNGSPLITRRFFLAILFALLGGLLLNVASPALSLWPAVFPAIALILISLWGRSFWAGTLLGAVGGASFWFTHISWLTLYLGPIPWSALAGVMTLWFALFGGAIAFTTRILGTVLHDKPRTRFIVLSIAVAGLWIAREQISGAWPYGGFAWGRVALTQADSPLGSLASWLGFAGLGFVMVWAVSLTLAVWNTYSDKILRREPLVTGTRIALIAPALGVVLLMAVPSFSLKVQGTARIAGVQGNSDSAIFADRKPGDSLNAHFQATLPIIDEDVDLLVWPENASDLDPNRVPEAAKILDALSQHMGVPIVVGTITAEDDRYFNSALVWETGKGVTAQYDKKHPVPFAEYMPNRDFFHALVPDLVDLVQLEYTPGERSPVMPVAGFSAGVAICFDIVDDALARQMVQEGAEFILAPTNNADFGDTDQSVQQLAIAQLRAIETGRAVVNVSTVGTSAIILPNGTMKERLIPFTADTMIYDVPRVTGSTPAMLWGEHLALAVSILGYFGFAAAIYFPLAGFFKRRSPQKG
ncbi:apolipoprotein N-acyltransferase [Lysinibacter sp. HNR]|uniref:apolipoprotein N-acyltransferase n=1 Tax=Lysinibacter sp. HNR TaxID=3031408 RepID=UPI0024357869|nr:apolipoprotein N-acyltransferase [Lysinibacter sp. HNR]WGD36223.1 apolipoprotein N-acyltransferase [Lysinibacter sp. HNR]